MYIKKAFFLNCGPTKNLDIEFQFNENGTPKPVLLVGENGSGKTNILSFITDALYGIADKVFPDIMPDQKKGYNWYRAFKETTTSTGQFYEIAILKFMIKNGPIYYNNCIVNNNVQFRMDQDSIQNQLNDFDSQYKISVKPNEKIIEPDSNVIGDVFKRGCYISFPVNRNELPFWSDLVSPADPVEFIDQNIGILDKPILVEKAIDKLKSWIYDVWSDYISYEYLKKINNNNENNTIESERNNIIFRNNYANLNRILQTILRKDSAQIIRWNRHLKNSKICIVDGNGDVILPSLDAASSGQAMLLSIFGTILRYNDRSDIFPDMKDMKGIVLIDEVDAHLHVDLLYSVLPELIKLFPKIQFIMTAHNPLFVLGMNNAFGEDGYTLLELPEGKRITAERYKEFETAFKYVKDTKAFENELRKIIDGIDAKNKSCILCEGKTDEDYWNTAAQIFGYEELLNKTIIKCVGTNDGNHSRDNGKSALDKAYKFLEIHKEIFKNKIIFLYDCDVKNPGIFNKKNDFLNQYFVDQNPKNTRFTKGVENLFPVEAFENYCPPKYFNSDMVDPYYNKKDMCNELCKNKDPKVFANFEPILKKLQKMLLET